MKFPPDPGALKSSGVESLPCGFSLAVPFRARVQHYTTCAHTYCKWRKRAAGRMAKTLAADMKKHAKR